MPTVVIVLSKKHHIHVLAAARAALRKVDLPQDLIVISGQIEEMSIQVVSPKLYGLSLGADSILIIPSESLALRVKLFLVALRAMIPAHWNVFITSAAQHQEEGEEEYSYLEIREAS